MAFELLGFDCLKSVNCAPPTILRLGETESPTSTAVIDQTEQRPQALHRSRLFLCLPACAAASRLTGLPSFVPQQQPCHSSMKCAASMAPQALRPCPEPLRVQLVGRSVHPTPAVQLNTSTDRLGAAAESRMCTFDVYPRACPAVSATPATATLRTAAALLARN